MSKSPENHNKPVREPIDLTVKIVVGAVVIIGVAITIAICQIFFPGVFFKGPIS